MVAGIRGWITGVFFDAPVDDHAKKIKADLAEECDQTSDQQLEAALTHTINAFYKDKKVGQARETTQFINTLVSYLDKKNDIWNEGVVKCVALTLVEELYTPSEKDALLLNSLIQCQLPLNPSKSQKANGWVEFGRYYVTELFQRNDYADLPHYIQSVISDYSENCEIKKLSGITKKFSVNDLSQHLPKEVCKSFLVDIISAILLNHEKVKLNNVLPNIQSAIGGLELGKAGADQTEKVVQAIAPLISSRFVLFFNSLFTKNSSIVDAAVAIFAEHLNKLQHSRVNVVEKIELRKRATHPLLFDKETIDPSIESEDKVKFLKKYNYNFLEYIEFRNDDRNKVLKDEKKISHEVGNIFYDIAEKFLEEQFVISLVMKINEILEFKDSIRESDIRSALPAIKNILKAYLIQFMENEFFDKNIEPFLEKDNIQQILDSYILPGLKQMLYIDIVQKVMYKNIEKPHLIKEEVRKVLKEQNDDEVNSVIDAVAYRFSEFKARYGESGISDKQLFAMYIQYTPEQGDRNKSKYFEAVEAIFNDFSGFSSIFKGVVKFVYFIVNLFYNIKKETNEYITSIFATYRTTPKYAATVIETAAYNQYPLPGKNDSFFIFRPLRDRVKIVPFQPTDIKEVSRLFYISLGYNTSFYHRFKLWCALGSEGKEITEIYNNVLSNTLYKGSRFNIPLLVNLLTAIKDKVAPQGVAV